VPTRDSHTGAITTHFRDAFEARRSRGLRPDVDASAWGHLYQLALNTQFVSAGHVTISLDNLLEPHPLRPARG